MGLARHGHVDRERQARTQFMRTSCQAGVTVVTGSRPEAARGCYGKRATEFHRDMTAGLR
jgi:hypothetical protein